MNLLLNMNLWEGGQGKDGHLHKLQVNQNHTEANETLSENVPIFGYLIPCILLFGSKT